MMMAVMMGSIQALANSDLWPRDGAVTCSVYKMENNKKELITRENLSIKNMASNSDQEIEEGSTMGQLKLKVGAALIDLSITAGGVSCSDGNNCDNFPNRLWLSTEAIDSKNVELESFLIDGYILRMDFLRLGKNTTVEDNYNLLDAKTRKVISTQKVICTTAKAVKE